MRYSLFKGGLLQTLILLMLAACLPFIVKAQTRYWQQEANFIIDVTLNDSTHTLDAFEEIEYINNSPDTLRFIWFHLWPNAYKNDRTAFSEQLLVNGRTDFYFSNKEQRGYINRLDFKVNGNTASLEDHPQHIDIIKLLLPEPLAPRQKITITTPFHVKLPDNFSRGGHKNQSYQVTQWFPKPAVYDHEGWHPMPYLDQGEFYSEFGNYDVRITLPSNYVVAATGKLQNVDELKWMKEKALAVVLPVHALPKKNIATGKPFQKIPQQQQDEFPPSATTAKTLRFLQDRVHDFAWFADKRFIVNHDTAMLPSGKIISVFSYYLPADSMVWKNSIRLMKEAIHYRSGWLGEYPYDVATAVEAPLGFYGGMEYPTICGISPLNNERLLAETLEHELGHNWFYAAIASNERSYPWMDEGMNTFYADRYAAVKYGSLPEPATGLKSKLPRGKREAFLFENIAAIRKDQPVNTPADKFNQMNYGLVAYYKSAEWMKKLENMLGRSLFDSCMKAYYRTWQFRHPYPGDFKALIETVSHRNMDEIFSELDKKGSLLTPGKKKLQLTTFLNLSETATTNYLSIAPVPGYNVYDGFMIGAMVHNFQLPLNPFSFFVLPMYAVGSRQLQGMARASYTWYPGGDIYKWDVGAGFSRFSMNHFQPEGKEKIFTGFIKLAPFIRLTLREPDPLKKTLKFIQFKSFLISEDQLQFSQVINGTDTNSVVNLQSGFNYINQLKVVIANPRVLYPYSGEMIVEQHKDFFRAAFTGNYFFNYADGRGGLAARIFAGKFFYTGARTTARKLQTTRYHLNLSAPSGNEDYTYTNYFVARNDFENWGSRQVMIRDGAFKVNTGLLIDKTGKTDNWLLAGNFHLDIPENMNPLAVLPFKVPLKMFADIGTYADAWKESENANKVLFDAGLQLSLFRETLNIYIPLLYSRVFRDYYRSTPGSNSFLKTVSFSIDVQNFNLKKVIPDYPL